jgi:predicted AlkP superfamily phosphohydrolase/phosphomutase
VSSRFVLAAALILACAACSGDRAETPAKVVVLGLDGGTWDLLDGYIERGLLPNLARLRADGVRAPLRSIEPSSSPVIWTTIATGKSPEKHGITYFVRFPAGDTGKPQPVSSTLRRGKAIWNILSDRRRDVAIVGWFVTWPVETVDGRMISDRAHWGAIDAQGVFPPGYLDELPFPTMAEALEALPRFMNVDFDLQKLDPHSSVPEERLNFLVFDRFLKAYLRDLYYLRAAEQVLADGPLPDFFALYLRGTDDVQHGFWKFMEPQLFPDVTAEQAADFGQVIERYWQWTDAAVGRVLSFYEKVPRFVLVVSDHGAGPAVCPYKVVTRDHLHLSGSHRDTGILIAAGAGARRGASLTEASVHDVTPTLLHYFGEPVGDDMDGRVLTDLFVRAIAERPIEHVATYDGPDDRPAEHVASEVDEKALEHLRSLGYID